MSDTFVVGVGAYSPFGLDARQAALVTRASKLSPRPTSFADASGGRMANVRTPALADGMQGLDRMLALAVPALKEAMQDAALAASGPIPMFLALPEVRPDDDQRFGRWFLEAVASKTGVAIDIEASSFFRVGAVGVAAALERAHATIASTAAPALVGAVDSYHHEGVLAWLDREKRLLSDVVHNGFVPSEGAAFAVLAGPRHRGTRLAKLADAAVAQQPPPLPEDAKNGEALTELLRRMSSTIPGAAFPWVLSDVNGERHRVNEWMVARIRNAELVNDDETIEERLCDHAGDAGAATGALALSYVASAYRLGFARADRAIVVLSSEGAERGAFVLERA